MTAEEYLEDNYSSVPYEYEDIIKCMTEFARHHVEKTIEKIVDDNPGKMNKADIKYLLKSYPLENIK